jgi:hypothetical protein
MRDMTFTVGTLVFELRGEGPHARLHVSAPPLYFALESTPITASDLSDLAMSFMDAALKLVLEKGTADQGEQQQTRPNNAASRHERN